MSTVRLHVSDLAVARVAARRARAVPGVTTLVGDLQQTLLGLAADWLPRDPVPAELDTRGVVARVHSGAGVHSAAGAQDGEVDVRVSVGVRFGTPCAELAARVQEEVTAELAAVTGLTARVRVTIAHIDLPH